MDRDIRAAVYQELDADRLIDAADIEVEVVNGEVSLNGTVPSQDQRTAAATAARRVAGVTGVDNLLDVALPVATIWRTLRWRSGSTARSRRRACRTVSGRPLMRAMSS